MGRKDKSETTAPDQPTTGAELARKSGKEAYEKLHSDAPYTITDRNFLGMRVGESIRFYEDLLRDGEIQNGEGTFRVHFLDAAEGYELGYIVPEAEDAGEIGQIIITSENVVTEQGVRVGMTFGVLRKKLGELKVYGSPIEARTYVEKDEFIYRLDVNSPPGELNPEDVPASAKILYISLPQ